MDVISGALAVAGSSFNVVKINGSNIPIKLPVTTIKTIVSDATQIISGDRMLAIRATPTAMVTPNKSDTNNSLPINLYQSESSTSPVASERIIKVAD